MVGDIKGDGVKPGMDPNGNRMEGARRDKTVWGWGGNVMSGVDLQWEWIGGCGAGRGYGMDSEWIGLWGEVKPGLDFD